MQSYRHAISRGVGSYLVCCICRTSPGAEPVKLLRNFLSLPATNCDLKSSVCSPSDMFVYEPKFLPEDC